MIKFVSRPRKNKAPLVGLGLSEENIKRLKQGRPIRLDLKDLGLRPTEIMIFYGATEVDMRGELIRLGLIDDKTVEHIEGP